MDSDSKPAQPSAAQMPEPYEAVEQQIVGRFRVEKRSGGGFWPYCVKAGDGTMELFIGHKTKCEEVAQALQTACLDGAFMASKAAQPSAQGEAMALQVTSAELAMQQQINDLLLERTISDGYRRASRAALQTMICSAKQIVDGEVVVGYQIETGALHKLVAMNQGGGDGVFFPTNLQSIASPTAQPVAVPAGWQHLKAYGYAPGNYMSRCLQCGATPIMDKRATTCLPCAEAMHAAALAASPQPEQAQPVERARSLTDELMDCVDRLGSEWREVDPRVWDHLRVYMPAQPSAQGEAVVIDNKSARIFYDDLRMALRRYDAGTHSPADLVTAVQIALAVVAPAAQPSAQGEAVAVLMRALDVADRTFAENGLLACHAARQEIRAAIASAPAAPAQAVPPIDYEALIAAAFKLHGYRQGTGACIAFKHGAEWMRGIKAAP